MQGREIVHVIWIFRERMFGASPYEDFMEGVLEQRSELSSDRRRIPPLKGMWYKMIHLYHNKAQIRYLKLGGTAESSP